MKNKFKLSSKHVAIDKANAQTVAMVGISAFIIVFCLIAASRVMSQLQYESRLSSAKTTALNTLTGNIKAYSSLQTSYSTFVSASTNAIGGSSSGKADNDGTNAKIVLDALPSSYDFPALASSIEKILSSYKVSSIAGTDDQITQQANITSTNPVPVAIPFTFSVNSVSYDSAQSLMSVLQNSIRPIQIDTMTAVAGSSGLQITVNAHTYFQPAKNLSITKKVVK
jgi:hypothetical protein